LYTVDRLGNVVGGSSVRYINTTAKNLKKFAIDVLKSNRPVWFGCDVGQFSNSGVAAMDTDLYNYELAFNVKLGLTKEQRVLYGESLMTHAMVFSGVHLDEDGNPIRWRVENSWGDSTGDKGYWIMTDKWFEQFVYQVRRVVLSLSVCMWYISSNFPSIRSCLRRRMCPRNSWIFLTLNLLFFRPMIPWVPWHKAMK
jgi:aminopeptidase C